MKTKNISPVLLVHGGAWAIPAEMADEIEDGVRRATAAGYAVLRRGGAALDAVEAAISVMEDDPAFDAGRGSFLTSDGRVQMDALLMDGGASINGAPGQIRAGGVAGVERLRNPIQAARLVLDKSPHVYFVGPGAEEFAASQGMELIDNSELVIERERVRLAEVKARLAKGLGDITFSGASTEDDKEAASAARGWMEETFSHEASSHDTIGAVALDRRGNLAAGTSTGGTLNKTPGRVGDSSLIGCGCYADNEAAAVSLTGWGEPIMKLVLGKWATDRVQSGTAPNIAASDAIAYLHRRMGGHGGIILLGPDGRFGMAHNTPGMAWGCASVDGLFVGLAV